MNELAREPGKLRIAVITQSPGGAPVHQDNRDAVARAAALCHSLGHEVREAVLPEPFTKMMESFGVLGVVGVCAQIRGRAHELGREPGPDDLERVTIEMYRLGPFDQRARLRGGAPGRAAPGLHDARLHAGHRRAADADRPARAMEGRGRHTGDAGRRVLPEGRGLQRLHRDL
ncbi:MAG: hypothetical protein IPO61_17970 [Gammaproteobacteria bacterium]|nr:hypothetical protein [Gammaproteobacteria bacterium]